MKTKQDIKTTICGIIDDMDKKNANKLYKAVIDSIYLKFMVSSNNKGNQDE